MSPVRSYVAVKVSAVIAAATAALSFFATVSATPDARPVAPLTAAQSQAFWSHWGDGRAELSGYRLQQPRYGSSRPGTAVLIYVTEDFSDSLRVKADPGKHPASDVYPVLKLNAVRDFQTGIYDYNVMTSTFARVAPAWPIAKVSFSSQEWCGHVWHQLLPRGGSVAGVSHSYFDGEADRSHGRRDADPRAWLDRRIRAPRRLAHGAVPAEPAARAPRPQAAGVGARDDQRCGRAVVGGGAGRPIRCDRLDGGAR
jgi:hypothetical protein